MYSTEIRMGKTVSSLAPDYDFTMVDELDHILMTPEGRALFDYLQAPVHKSRCVDPFWEPSPLTAFFTKGRQLGRSESMRAVFIDHYDSSAWRPDCGPYPVSIPKDVWERICAQTPDRAPLADINVTPNAVALRLWPRLGFVSNKTRRASP